MPLHSRLSTSSKIIEGSQMKKNLTAMASASIVLLSACGGPGGESREEAMEAQARRLGIDADVTLDASGEVGRVEITGPGGARYGSNVTLPSDFPSDVPIDDGWSIVAVTPAPMGGYMLQALTDRDLAAATERLAARFTDAGWSETTRNQSGPQMGSLGFEKGDRMATVNLIAGGEQLSVQLMTMPKP
jgi:hypothetical protein